MDDQAPDIRPYVTDTASSVRVQAPGVGTVTIANLDAAGFLRSYPAAWASLADVDAGRVAAASEGLLTPAAATVIKQLLAAALVREFAEPREGRVVPAEDLPGPLFSDAQDMIARALGSHDAHRLSVLIATMFDRPLEPTRRVVDAYLQRDDR